MSYDLNVYGTTRLSRDALIALVREVEGVDPIINATDGDLDEIVDQRTGRLVFTVDGPFDLEPEDGGSEAVRAAGVNVLYGIVVPDADENDIATARSFADRLAERILGYVLDPQADVSKQPHVHPSRKQHELYLHVGWYRLRDGASEFADIYLSAAKGLFAPAVPARFGRHEPLQGKFPRDDFGDAYRRQCAVSSLLFSSKVIRDGRVDGWTDELRSRFQAIHVTLDFGALEGASLDHVEAFFLEVARRSGSFFGFVELNSTPYLDASPPPFEGGWSGLPAEPQWMTWYMPAYAEMARPYLSPGTVLDFPEGTFHRWTSAPAESAQLRTLVTRSPWIHPDLLPNIEPARHEVRDPARIMPSSLRRPEPGSPEAVRIEKNIARNRSKEVRQ